MNFIQNSNPNIASIRRAIQRRQKPVRALLGDVNDVLFTASDPIGKVRVRFVASSNEDGVSTYTDYTLVNAGTRGVWLPRVGREVWVGVGYDDELEILGGVAGDYASAGIDTRALNPNTPERQFVRLTDATRLMSRPVGTGVNPSALVTVMPALFDFYGSYTAYEGTTTTALKVDMTSLFPPSGQRRLAVVWVSLLDRLAYATASVSQVELTFDATDINEAFVDRPFEGVPVQAYLLQGGQTTITSQALWLDLRQFINTPPENGVPIVTTRRYNVRDNRRVLTYGTLTIDKTFLNEGSVTIL